MHDERDDLQPEDAVLLPDREVMSIVPIGDYASGIPGVGDPTAGAATGESAATDAAGSTDAQGSASGGESTTTDDRHEQITASDTATAQS